jgi:hypothetical protein
MNTPDQTIIELSRKKIILLALGSCVFVTGGIWMLLLDDAFIRAMGRNPTYVHGVGGASVLFFGLCGIVAFMKLFDKKPGLIFDAAGVVDNASGLSAGLIPWSEIIGAKTFTMRGQNMLIIEIKDPEKYLGRGNWLKKLAVNANYKICGTPITISAIALKASFFELLSLFNQYQQKYGGTKPDHNPH